MNRKRAPWQILLFVSALAFAEHPPKGPMGWPNGLFLHLERWGSHAVGNGGQFLISQVQHTIQYRLMALLEKPENRDVLTPEELKAIKTLVTTEGIPISAVNPVDLPDDKYYVEENIPAKTRGGRLLSNHGLAVDSRVVLNKILKMKPEIQIHEMAWNQYTWGGFHLPTRLLPHLLHEVIRYAFFRGIIKRNDDDSLISSKLDTTNDKLPFEFDYELVARNRKWFTDIPGNTYTGRALCNVFLDPDKKDDRICETELSFGDSDRNNEGRFALEVLESESNEILTSIKGEYKLGDEKGKVRLILDQGRSLIWHTLRTNDILRFGWDTQLFRIDKGAPTVVRMKDQDDYQGLVFCEDLDYLKKPRQSFSLDLVGIKHSSELICRVSMEFKSDATFQLTVTGAGINDVYQGEYLQIGYNLLLQATLLKATEVKAIRTSFYLQIEKQRGNTIRFGNGQPIYRGGTPMRSEPVTKGQYSGLISCVQKTAKEELRGDCFVTVSLNQPEPGLAMYHIQMVYPHRLELREFSSVYRQAGNQLQLWRKGTQGSLSYFVGDGFLVDENRNKYDRDGHEKVAK